MYVKSVVPAEDLLVWILKEGWEPICSFLGKPIPEGPIPHENRTGDIEFKIMVTNIKYLELQ